MTNFVHFLFACQANILLDSLSRSPQEPPPKFAKCFPIKEGKNPKPPLNKVEPHIFFESRGSHEKRRGVKGENAGNPFIYAANRGILGKGWGSTFLAFWVQKADFVFQMFPHKCEKLPNVSPYYNLRLE